MRVKAITLWQPWATLIAIGAKCRETRCWAPRYIGPLAIHAGTNRSCLRLIALEPFRSVLAASGITSVDQMPFGAVVALARLGGNDPVEGIRDRLSAPERAFGDYRDGRHAWLIEAARPLRAPIPVMGEQGLWNWEAPEGLVEEFLRTVKETGNVRSSYRQSRTRRASRPTADARDQ